MSLDLINTQGKLNDNHYYKWLLENFKGGLIQNYRIEYINSMGLNSVPTDKDKILQSVENYFYHLNIKK